jgi:hypothetical protein
MAVVKAPENGIDPRIAALIAGCPLELHHLRTSQDLPHLGFVHVDHHPF